MGDVVLTDPAAVTVGNSPSCTFVIPDLRLPADFAILRPGKIGRAHV